MHLDGRVALEPGTPRRGQEVRVDYRGLLQTSGADAVWLHYGFDGWYMPRTVPMHRDYDGSFSSRVRAEGTREMNFCFKDSADHWDNNNGQNWECKIY